MYRFPIDTTIHDDLLDKKGWAIPYESMKHLIDGSMSPTDTFKTNVENSQWFNFQIKRNMYKKKSISIHNNCRKIIMNLESHIASNKKYPMASVTLLSWYYRSTLKVPIQLAIWLLVVTAATTKDAFILFDFIIIYKYEIIIYLIESLFAENLCHWWGVWSHCHTLRYDDALILGIH